MLPNAFDHWFEATFAREGTFTMFIVLFQDAPGTIVPVGSSYLHVVGPDVTWLDIVALVAESGIDWQSVGIFAAKAETGGPLPDALARRRQASLDAAILRDRLTIRRGELFDLNGRMLALSLVSGHA